MKPQEKKHLNIEDIETMSKEEIVSFFVSEQEKSEAKEIEIESLNKDLTLAKEIIKQLQSRLFGPKTEKTEFLKGQMCLLFDEVEISAEIEEEPIDESAEETITYIRKKGRKKLTESNPNLEVKETEHIISECIDQGYEVIGSKETEKLIYIPAELYIQKDIYPVYRKEQEDGTDDIKTLYKGYEFLDKSPATPSLVASILNDKYAKALPLYRIEESFKNSDANISRQTMSNWALKTSKQYLEPLYDLMKKDLISKDIIHADETTVQVLNHQDGLTNIKSYMWLYRSGVHDDKIILYEYQPGRSAHYPEEFLKGFKGYLQTDGYSVYKNIEDAIQVGCIAHGRRKIKEALEVMKKKTKGTQISAKVFNTMNHIMRLDKSLKKKHEDFNLLQKAREKELMPLFNQLEEELNRAQTFLLPKSRLGAAINYNLNQFESFKNALKDPRLELTNNIAERAIKPFVIGRKNWLFSNTSTGAKSSAIIYSIVQSAKDNNLKVEDYLTYVFKTMSETNQEALDLKTLLPHSKTLPKELYSHSKK